MRTWSRDWCHKSKSHWLPAPAHFTTRWSRWWFCRGSAAAAESELKEPLPRPLTPPHLLLCKGKNRRNQPLRWRLLSCLSLVIILPLKMWLISVSVQLQTPSRLVVLPSRLDDWTQAADVNPQSGIDAIVSPWLEEAGQRILRVEVGYMSNGIKTLRKCHKFNVAVPLNDRNSSKKWWTKCLVSIAVENVME